MDKKTQLHFKLDPKSLRAKLEKPAPDTTALTDLICDRIEEGRRFNTRNWRHYWALDQAYDAPLENIAPTLMRSLLTGEFPDEEVLEKAKKWGLAQFIHANNTEGADKKKVATDLPVFFSVTLPVLRAYLHIRWGKLYNDRDLVPMLKYEPIKNTMKNRVRGEIISDRVEFMASQFGWRSELRQMIFHALHYGQMIAFPAEDWFKDRETFVGSNGEVQERVKKAGIRHNIPHPTRVFWDQAHRIGTINSDTGVRFAGYWRVVRFGEIQGNDAYYNKDKVSFNTGDIIGVPSNDLFFQTVCPCTLRFPSQQTRSGAGQLDRESQLLFFTSDHVDQGVILTDIFMKLIPKEHGLGSYDKAVWMRFLVANDDTILYASVIPYNPLIYMGYDSHDERAMVASLSSELMPFQDHMSNLLSQQILSAKENLASVIFYNKDLIPSHHVERIENLGESKYRTLNFIPFSARTLRVGGEQIREAFHNVQFPSHDIVGLVSTFRTLLDMLERVLVFSAQEVGATATHEQTAEEIRATRVSVSNRLEFTGGFIDDGMNAWRRQAYEALMAFGDETVWAQIPTVHRATREALEKLGFKIEEPSEEIGDGERTAASVSGPKAHLLMEGFSSARESLDRANSSELAIAMSQVLQVVINNPVTLAAVGANQVIEILNQIGQLGGLPRDFRLTVANPDLVQQMERGQDSQAEQLPQIIQDLTARIMDATDQRIAAAVEPIVQEVQAQGQETQEAVPALQAQLQALFDAVAQIQSDAQNVPTTGAEPETGGGAPEDVELARI